MTFTDAAEEVLRKAGHPLHYKEITEIAIDNNLLSHVGKSPEVTMGARLAATLKKAGETNPLIRVKPGVFALKEWDEETIKKGLEIKRAPRKAAPKIEDEETMVSAAPEAVAEVAKEVETKAKDPDDELLLPQEEAPAEEKPKRTRRRRKPRGEEEPTVEASEAEAETPAESVNGVSAPAEDAEPDEALRAEIAASASDVFADEDDDDQPLLKSIEEDAEPSEGGRRRRRRRRRRGSRSEKGGDDQTLPAFTAKPVDDDSLPRGPQVIELSSDDLPSLDEVAGKPLADAVAAVLASFDRTVGAVSLRQIADTAQRHGKLNGDTQLIQSHIAAAVRADNARSSALGWRPRFRLAGGRIGLSHWSVEPELARMEQEVIAALHKYRDASRRALARKVGDLPGHAFVELVLMVLERMGVSQLTAVKFPGASGAEAHFSGVLHAPSGRVPTQVGIGEGVRLAVVVRKDGRDLGRERVTELRGSAHHYQGAVLGYLFTGGQLLSGSKEEATVEGAMPVTVLDALSVAKLCEDYAVGVIQATHPVSVVDVDLFDALRSS
ncbi:MAG: HTH domain-containing protein [Myxococcota bacterium]